MEEIKKTNENELEKVAGGAWHSGSCFRCGSDDSYGECKHKWYGKVCCEKCFKILSDREEQDYKSSTEAMKEIKELKKMIKQLIGNNNNNNNNY